MSWLVLIFAATMLLLLRKRFKKWRKWWLVGGFAMVAACSFADTKLGAGAAELLRKLLGFPAGWIDATAAMLAAVLVLPLLALVIYGFVHDRRADKPELIGLALLPLLFIIASGPVADNGGKFSDAVSNFGAEGLGYFLHDEPKDEPKAAAG